MTIVTFATAIVMLAVVIDVFMFTTTAVRFSIGTTGVVISAGKPMFSVMAVAISPTALVFSFKTTDTILAGEHVFFVITGDIFAKLFIRTMVAISASKPVC